MSKVHITLVGGQSMPVYLGIKYCNPEKVLFVYSNESEKQKQIIKNELPEGIVSLKTDPLDAVNMEEIENAARSYKEKFKDDEVTLNISGGTKAWSYFFSKEFENMQNATIIYVDQNNEVYNLKEKTHEKVPFEFMMQFRLNKNPLQHYKKFSDYTETDIKALEEIERVRKIDIGIFTELTNLDRNQEAQLKNQPHGKFQTKNASIDWDKKGKCVISFKKKGEIITNEICSPNITGFIFNAGWFELKVAHIISQWEKTKEIFMNCKFLIDNKEKDSKNIEEFPKNEIDIIINTGEKALFVECKTNLHTVTDIDKFNTAVRNYGGSGSKALFICLNKFSENALQKFSDCGTIWHYSFKESQDIQSFYDMLNRRIEKINK
ncbi:MAG: DUF1887 family protein [Treponemataceae bacterium]|nr:DUF1887 family protein [Treponemataceae bacterium]